MSSLAFNLVSFSTDYRASKSPEEMGPQEPSFLERVVKAIGCCFSNPFTQPTELKPIITLHQACATGNLARARELMRKGADPYQPNSNGITPLHHARNNLALLKILTKTENHPKFRDCQTVHDFWAIVYPGSKTEIPENCKQLLLKVPMWSIQKVLPQPKDGEILPSMADLVEGLEEEEERQYTLLTQIGSVTIPRESYTLSMEQVVAYLRKHHPLFDASLKIAGEPSIQQSDFSGPRFHAEGSSACYSAKSHSIFVEGQAGYADIIYSITFEVMNALGREAFLRIEELAASGELSREENTFLVEGLEFKSLSALLVLFPEFNIHPVNVNFGLRWQMNNISLGEGLLSHADFTRMKWDALFSIPYFLKHRASFEERLKELRNK